MKGGGHVGRVAHPSPADHDRALEAAQQGFEIWRNLMPAERSKVMRAGRRKPIVLYNHRASRRRLLREPRPLIGSYLFPVHATVR